MNCTAEGAEDAEGIGKMILGQRIMIIGCGGAGKSTLARRLGERLGLPVVHLDAHYWHAGWVETPKEAWRETVARLVAGERWIMDGNFGGTIELRMAAADTIIFLDFPRTLCLWRVVWRWLTHRGRTRPDMTPGCPERLDGPFLLWIWRDFPRRNRPNILRLLEEYGARKQVMVLRLPRDVQRLLQPLPLKDHPFG
jgi:adenylate kinase family enzyme